MNTLASRSPILPSSTAIVTDAPASGSPILLHPQRWRSSSAIGMDAPAQGSKNWLRHAGASIAMALDGRWRWEGGSLTLTLRLRWRLIDAGVEKGAKTGSVTLALPLRWRVTGAGVGREPSSRRSSCAIASAPPRPGRLLSAYLTGGNTTSTTAITQRPRATSKAGGTKVGNVIEDSSHHRLEHSAN